MDCVVVWFCFNSSANFAKHFCWLVIRLDSEEGIGAGGGGGGASDLIKCVKIINKGCETNRKEVAENEKKNVNLDGNYQVPNGNRQHRQLVLETLKKATLTELKGEKVCCLFWILARKLSNRAAGVCNLGGGRRRSFYETSQITIWVDLTSVEFDYWVTNVELS